MGHCCLKFVLNTRIRLSNACVTFRLSFKNSGVKSIPNLTITGVFKLNKTLRQWWLLFLIIKKSICIPATPKYYRKPTENVLFDTDNKVSKGKFSMHVIFRKFHLRVFYTLYIGFQEPSQSLHLQLQGRKEVSVFISSAAHVSLYCRSKDRSDVKIINT